MVRRAGVLIVFVLGAAGAEPLRSQVAPEAPVALEGKVERVKVPGTALEGNLLGESSSPDVSIYLPPSYERDHARRYPVVYLLHGYGSADLVFFGPTGIELEIIANRVFERGAAHETILVMPNCLNAFGGCMYSSSVTTGDWETYIAHDLVAYIDSHYRTLPRREARGLAGTSMGGYGALRIGMKRPDAFAAIYALSACCLDEGTVYAGITGEPSAAELVRSLDEVRGQVGVAQRTLARAAAWSPNPSNSPLYIDLPNKNGAVVREIAEKWAANSPLAMLDQYVPNLRKYRAIALDVGLRDIAIASNRTLSDRLTRYRIPHTFETHDGGHSDRLDQRLEQYLLPFFSTHLAFE